MRLFLFTLICTGFIWMTPVTMAAPLPPYLQPYISEEICANSLEGLYQRAGQMASSYPELAQLEVIGPSWRKSRFFSSDGYDLKVLVLGRQSNTPKLVLIQGLDSRDFQAPQLAIEFAQYLLDNYEQDAQTRFLLDEHQLHIVLVANPDGRHLAEQALREGANARGVWNKNDNTGARCNLEGKKACPQCVMRLRHGVDLEHNFDFKWKRYFESGDFFQYSHYANRRMPGQPCHESFGGWTAASEPETRAIQNYLDRLFADHAGSLTYRSDNRDLVLQLMHGPHNKVLIPVGAYEKVEDARMALMARLALRLGAQNGTRSIHEPSHGFSGSAFGYAQGRNNVAALGAYMAIAGHSCDAFSAEALAPHFRFLRTALALSRSPFGRVFAPQIETAQITDNLLTVETADPVNITVSHGYFPKPVVSGVMIKGVRLYIGGYPWESGIREVELERSQSGDEQFSLDLSQIQGELNDQLLVLEPYSNQGPGTVMVLRQSLP